MIAASTTGNAKRPIGEICANGMIPMMLLTTMKKNSVAR